MASKKKGGSSRAKSKSKSKKAQDRLAERVQQVRKAIAAEPRDLATFPSAEAARLRGQEGLVQVPYLSVTDLLHLRHLGFKDIEDLEARWTEIPDEVWPRIVHLVEARVIRLPTEVPKDA